jgi:emp24/gp25L/p24 family/GOLD
MISNRVLGDNRFPMKRREQLESPEGSFEYETLEFDGQLEICVQSYTATADAPSRVAVSIDIKSENEEIAAQLEAELKLLNARLEAENHVVKEETSRITSELIRMQRRALMIASDAQFSKAREEAFHSQSIALNRAVKYWPMIRLAVLLIGGYLQVTHVVNFMKSRHIY